MRISQPTQHSKECACLRLAPTLAILALWLETTVPDKSAADSSESSPTTNVSNVKPGNISVESTSKTAGMPSAEVPKDEINPKNYTSSRVCGNCHADIYSSWRNSLHAFSISDPIFDAAFMQALKESAEAKRVCLRCHAPMTMFNEDYDLTLGVTGEGVSCDFCHTITDVHLDNPERPYSFEPGLVKRSVLRRASSPKHKVAYSELHSKAEFCGGCHNFTNARGTPIMSTFTEWKTGPYSTEGTQCQNCHMRLSEGHVVRQEIKESRSSIHRHSLIHDREQIRSALSLEIARAERRSNDVTVEVVIRNVGSGHKVPTGIPSREVVLRVEVKVGARTWKEERRYRKVVADAHGQELVQDHEILLNGARIISDNRIGPREERRERFHFFVPEGTVAVTATIDYLYRPALLQRREIQIELGRAEHTVF